MAGCPWNRWPDHRGARNIGKRIGVSHLYSRIFWPKKTLPAFARAKLKRADASGRYSHMRIAQNGVTISVNRESRLD